MNPHRTTVVSNLMKTRVLLKFAVVAIICTATLNASAWNRASHMASGAIAYQFLKQYSPTTIAKVIKLLKAHPQFGSRWKAKYDSLPDIQKDLFLFMAAARWPDDIRGTNYDHPDWHHYDYPVTILPSDTQPPKQDNSLTQFANNLNIMKSQSATQANRAIALCWVFHLMGELHQPMRTVTLYSAAFPAGDHGGADFLIKDPAKDLHGYWDNVFLADSKASYKSATWINSVNDAAKGAKTKNGAVTFNSSMTIDTKAIVNESIELAKNSGYRFKGKALKPGVKGGAAASALPAGYAADASRIASKQITLSGMRLAVLLYHDM